VKSVDEVWQLIDEHVKPLPAERAALEAAHGLVLRESAIAPEDAPAFDRSAVDGFLVRTGSGEGSYRLVGDILPGQPAPAAPREGEAYKIFTGSALPASGAAVIMLEDTATIGTEVVLRARPGESFIRRQGSQARKGDALLHAGVSLNAGALALLASLGLAEPLVSPRVRVAHIVTGSEIVPAGATPRAGAIRDSNTPLIASLLRDADAVRVFGALVSEQIDASVAVCREAAEKGAHLYLISGGASVGEHDGTARALEEIGFAIHVSKMNSRPGKPMIFATRGAEVAFGLPGNPLSHFVCFQLFVRRAIDRLMGRASLPLVRVTVDGEAPEANPRETWWPARVSSRDGRLHACALPWRDSSDLTGLAAANALLRIPSGPRNGLAEAVVFATLGA